MKPKSEDNFFMVANGNGLSHGEVRTYVPGQVLDIALHARIRYCTHSEEHQRWRLRRGHVYDINAHVESVTIVPTDEADYQLAVIDCGELMFADFFLLLEDFPFGYSTFSARIELSVEHHSEYLKDHLPGYARMFNQWQVENIYVPVPGAPPTDDFLAVAAREYQAQAVSEVALRSWMDASSEDSCLLECRRVKPATPQHQLHSEIGSSAASPVLD